MARAILVKAPYTVRSIHFIAIYIKSQLVMYYVLMLKAFYRPV